MKRIFFSILTLLFLATSARASDIEFVVDCNGGGDFLTIQEAVDAAPDYFKSGSTLIRIRKGIYREKLTIPTNKQRLHLVGEDPMTTIITHSDYALQAGPDGEPIGTSATSTVFLYADDFLAENLTIENAAGEGKSIAQACAITIDADRVAFVNCRFVANQDTIYTYGKNQRQYFRNCWIEGTTDFIFGASTCWFEECTILSKKNSYITAASTPKGTAFGYVFHNCTLIAADGVDKVYLGRPWRPFARTVFLSCNLGGHILPEGWHDWGKDYAHSTVLYAEYDSHGPGAASPSKRTGWSKILSRRQAARYTPERVLDAGKEIDKNGNYIPVIWFFKVF